MKTRVCILSGGDSAEREISVQSAENVLKYVKNERYDGYILEIKRDDKREWIRELADNPPDIVLSTLHGGNGENGAVQGLLECMGIPYIGSKVAASAVGMDKNLFKTIMRYNNIPVAQDLFIKKGEDISIYRQKIEMLGFPLIVKPDSGGLSIGIEIAKNFGEIEEAKKNIEKLGDDILIEKYLRGREVTCGVMQTSSGLEVLSVLEIKTEKNFYDYDSKYTDELRSVDFSTLPDFLQTMIQEIAKKVFTVLNCRGYGNVDMIIDEEQVYVIEINTLPGLTEKSLIPKAAEIMDKGFGRFIERLIEFELKKEE